MAFGHITSWHKDREKVEAVKDFIFYGSKTTVDGAMKLEDACFLEGRLRQTCTVLSHSEMSDSL